jgi:hypothetical protein
MEEMIRWTRDVKPHFDDMVENVKRNPQNDM